MHGSDRAIGLQSFDRSQIWNRYSPTITTLRTCLTLTSQKIFNQKYNKSNSHRYNICYITVLSHNSHTQNSLTYQNNHSLFVLTKLWLHGYGISEKIINYTLDAKSFNTQIVTHRPNSHTNPNSHTFFGLTKMWILWIWTLSLIYQGPQ